VLALGPLALRAEELATFVDPGFYKRLVEAVLEDFVRRWGGEGAGGRGGRGGAGVWALGGGRWVGVGAEWLGGGES
jgi:hypothetical protein